MSLSFSVIVIFSLLSLFFGSLKPETDTADAAEVEAAVSLSLVVCSRIRLIKAFTSSLSSTRPQSSNRLLLHDLYGNWSINIFIREVGDLAKIQNEEDRTLQACGAAAIGRIIQILYSFDTELESAALSHFQCFCGPLC